MQKGREGKPIKGPIAPERLVPETTKITAKTNLDIIEKSPEDSANNESSYTAFISRFFQDIKMPENNLPIFTMFRHKDP